MGAGWYILHTYTVLLTQLQICDVMRCLCQSWDPLIMRAQPPPPPGGGGGGVSDWVAATASVVLRWWPSQHAPCQHTMGGNCETVSDCGMI